MTREKSIWEVEYDRLIFVPHLYPGRPFVMQGTLMRPDSRVVDIPLTYDAAKDLGESLLALVKPHGQAES